MFDNLNWRDRKELGQLSKEVRAEVVRRGGKAPKFKPDVAALVAGEIGGSVADVVRDPLESYRRAVDLMRAARVDCGATPGNLVSRFGTGPLQYRKHYGVVSERLVGMPRQISVGGW